MEEKKVILIDDMEIYKLAMQIGEDVWSFVDTWDYFKKDTIGKQLVRAADSIAANFSEGYGRFTFKDRRNFCYISRGSMFETRTWLLKAKNRNMIKDENYNEMYRKLAELHQKLNSYIKTLKENIETK
jgi:four helix bundle protein